MAGGRKKYLRTCKKAGVPGVKRKYREASEPNRDQTLQDLSSQGKDVGFYPVSSGMLWKGSNVLFEF